MALHGNMHCPDPTAHKTKDTSQSDASTAALLAAKSVVANPLGPDGKLSSANAATSIKYAKPQDLPGFPVVGIDTTSSANKAALLAAQKTGTPVGWKPEISSAAGTAALLAHDYKAAPSWQTQASTASTKAALLAHNAGGKQQTLTQGNDQYVDRSRNSALTAATLSHSASSRQRAQSNPPAAPYPDAQNSARNALSAATLAHSPSMKTEPPAASFLNSNQNISGAMEAARIQHAKSVSREMYTSTPPVAIETNEREHNAALRASAISMAKQMYNVQRPLSDGNVSQAAARTGATTAHSKQPLTSEADTRQQAVQYIRIQEAAQKLAQERLAKIGYDEGAGAAYRAHYGFEQPARTKLSIRGRNRARSASESAPAKGDSDSDDDDFRSRRIRSQMQHLNNQVAGLDAKKREDDRKSLLAAAQRKVQAQMQAQDKKIFDQTGKMSPAMISEWDEKARKRALASSEARMETHGKVHVGGGKWMDQADINAIAQARIQPTLDEITERTEKRRAEEEERRLELQEKKRYERVEKERAAEMKADEKHAKDEERKLVKAHAAEEKAATKQVKHLAKMEREAGRVVEKAKSADEERIPKEAQHRANEPLVISAPFNPTKGSDHHELHHEQISVDQVHAASEHEVTETTSPASPTSPSSSKGFKALFGKLKRHSKHSPTDEVGESLEEKPEKPAGEPRDSSIAAALHMNPPPIFHDAQEGDANVKSRPTDLGDVEPSAKQDREHDRYSNVSSLHSEDGMAGAKSVLPHDHDDAPITPDIEWAEAQDHFDASLAPPPTFTSDTAQAKRLGSPTRESRFHEIGI